jgi:hypothetical protein
VCPLTTNFFFFSPQGGPVISYKMPVAISLTRFTIWSSHQLIETQKVSHSGGNNHFGGA